MGQGNTHSLEAKDTLQQEELSISLKIYQGSVFQFMEAVQLVYRSAGTDDSRKGKTETNADSFSSG